MKRDQTYQVVSRSAVTVEFANGNVVSYPSGFMFQAHPTNTSVTRLLRNNLVRKVTAREVPRFKTKIDTESNARAATPPAQAPSPQLAAAKKAAKKSAKKPKRGEE